MHPSGMILVPLENPFFGARTPDHESLLRSVLLCSWLVVRDLQHAFQDLDESERRVLSDQLFDLLRISSSQNECAKNAGFLSFVSNLREE